MNVTDIEWQAMEGVFQALTGVPRRRLYAKDGNHLERRHRRLFVLALHMCGLKQSTIGRIFGTTADAVKRKCQQARRDTDMNPDARAIVDRLVRVQAPYSPACRAPAPAPAVCGLTKVAMAQILADQKLGMSAHATVQHWPLDGPVPRVSQVRDAREETRD